MSGNIGHSQEENIQDTEEWQQAKSFIEEQVQGEPTTAPESESDE